jgi:hypothetical protein
MKNELEDTRGQRPVLCAHIGEKRDQQLTHVEVAVASGPHEGGVAAGGS